LLIRLNTGLHEKYTLLPGIIKLFRAVEAILVHGLTDNVAFWLNLLRIVIGPCVAEYKMPELVLIFPVSRNFYDVKVGFTWLAFDIFIFYLD
jgi:hypothetical protein